MADNISASRSGKGAGYWRGTPPRAGGTGSMAGPRGAGGTAPKITPWQPTVTNLVALVVLELAAYSALRWLFREVHGG